MVDQVEILWVDDEALLLRGLAHALAKQANVKITMLSSLEEALMELSRYPAGSSWPYLLTILDINLGYSEGEPLPGGSAVGGLEILRLLLKAHPTAEISVVTGVDLPDSIHEGLRKIKRFDKAALVADTLPDYVRRLQQWSAFEGPYVL